MKLVLDTNILLVILSKKSKYHKIFEALINGEFIICITNEILEEYNEIITRFLGVQAAILLNQILNELDNVEFIRTYYAWNLITVDADDNKFVDCAIACNAKFIATQDAHFNVLKEITFPKVEIISIVELSKILK